MQNSKPVVLFDIDYTLFDTRKFKDSKLKDYSIYDEINKILTQLTKIASLGIFSKGETEFQRTKLEKTGMLNFFEEKNIYIFNDKDVNLISVLQKYKNSKLFLVDDRLEVLHSAKKYMPQIITVWVKRGPYAETQAPIENFVPSATIGNLSNLYRIVFSN
jgi:FMN phosphatase YigB (HAD superfamily)